MKLRLTFRTLNCQLRTTNPASLRPQPQADPDPPLKMMDILQDLCLRGNLWLFSPWEAWGVVQAQVPQLCGSGEGERKQGNSLRDTISTTRSLSPGSLLQDSGVLLCQGK